MIMYCHNNNNNINNTLIDVTFIELRGNVTIIIKLYSLTYLAHSVAYCSMVQNLSSNCIA